MVRVALVTTTYGSSECRPDGKAEATSRFVALCGATQGPQAVRTSFRIRTHRNKRKVVSLVRRDIKTSFFGRRGNIATFAKTDHILMRRLTAANRDGTILKSSSLPPGPVLPRCLLGPPTPLRVLWGLGKM